MAGKPAAWKGLVNLARAAAFTAVEVLAALQLHGWIRYALWVIVGSNAVFIGATLVGLSIFAARYVEQEQHGEAIRR